MKINKQNDAKDDKSIVCPVCKETTDITRVYSIPIDGSQILLHDDVGEIYQCGHADCMEYLLLVHDKFMHITKFDLLKRQKDITDLLTAEAGVARERLYPSALEASVMVEMADVLSTVLFHLTSENPYHRAYSVEEILGACKTMGFNPSKVDNRQIGYVLGWLQSNLS